MHVIFMLLLTVDVLSQGAGEVAFFLPSHISLLFFLTWCPVEYFSRLRSSMLIRKRLGLLALP